jgi:DedD protein
MPPPTADAAATRTPRYVVQIGAFADPASARDVRTKVERMGLTTYTHVIEVGGSPRIRVRVGPMSDRAEAQRILDRLKQAGLPGAVLTL